MNSWNISIIIINILAKRGVPLNSWNPLWICHCACYVSSGALVVAEPLYMYVKPLFIELCVHKVCFSPSANNVILTAYCLCLCQIHPLASTECYIWYQCMSFLVQENDNEVWSTLAVAHIHLYSLINKIYGWDDMGIIWRKLIVLVNTCEGTIINFCAVPGCSNCSDRKNHLSYYRLPLKNKSVLKQWIYNIGRANLLLKNHT